MGTTMTAALLCLVAAAELAATSWCALWPLRGQLDQLARPRGWWALYSFALGNLDVLLLAAAKLLTLTVLVLSAPVRQSRRRGRDLAVAGNHKTVRLAIGVLCGLFAAVLLVKSAAVAVTAPEQLWPRHQQQHSGAAAAAAAAAAAQRVVLVLWGLVGRGGGGVDDGGGGGGGDVPGGGTSPDFVGLVYLYVSIVASLAATLAEQLLGRRLVSQREEAWEAAEAAELAAEAADPLRAPLLAEAGAAGGKGAAAAARGAAAAAGAGAGGATASGGTREGSAGAGAAGTAAERGKKPKQRTLLELLRLALVDWHILLVAFSAGILAALGAALIPYLTGQIIDHASIDPNRAKFRRTLVQLLLVAAGTGVFTGTRGGLFTTVNARMIVRLRRKLFHSLLQLDVGFFDTTKTGEITSRLAADTGTVADQVGLNVNVLLRSATQAAMVLSFMFAASWRLTVVTFILIPAVLVVSQVYGKFFSKMSKRVQAELAAANGVAEEVLSTMTTVKAHAAQDSAEAAYASKLHDYYRLLLVEAALYAVYAVLTVFLPNLVSAVVLFYGGNLVLGGMMSPGALVSFMLYQQSLSSAFQMMGDVFSNLTAAVGAADKVVELMNRKPAIPPSGGLVLPALEGRVELQGVVFHYPARPDVRVLSGLSLVVEPGKVVALVGASGGGKSSIVKLLERFYLPTEGRVLIDGHELGLLEPKWLRRQVALVSQEPVLYARSIKRNIIFGLEPEDGCPVTPSDEEVVDAAKLANAHDFITSFPDGYDTNCGEKGAVLSGGQKQRIAIARALVRRPRVLLLDEATSALDSDSEAIVQQALDRVMAGRTVLVIAHRLSTIQNADKIIVVGKGVVQEEGTHEQLLAASGVYAQLVRRQLARPASQANFMALSTSTDNILHPSVSASSLTSLQEEAAAAAAGVGAGAAASPGVQRRATAPPAGAGGTAGPSGSEPAAPAPAAAAASLAGGGGSSSSKGAGGGASG